MAISNYTPTPIEVIHEINVDMSSPGVSQPIRLVQGDVSLPLILVKVTNSGEKIDLSVGYDEINLLIQNEKGYYKLNTIGYAYDNLNGVTGCYFRVTRDITTTVGTFEAHLQMISGSNESDFGYIHSITNVKVYVTKLASDELPPVPPPDPETPLINITELEELNTTWTDGKYVRYNTGAEIVNASYSCSDYIDLDGEYWYLIKYNAAPALLPQSTMLVAYMKTMNYAYESYISMNASYFGTGYCLFKPLPGTDMSIRVNCTTSQGYPKIYKVVNNEFN